MSEKFNPMARPRATIEQIRPSKKLLEVNSSSLVDLKVELARKQQEYRLQQLDPELKRKSKQATKGPAFLQNAGVSERAKRDQYASVEERKDLDKSRKALETKTALYNKLKYGAAATTDDTEKNECLIDFEQKAYEETVAKGETVERETPAILQQSVNYDETDGDDWVDYVDGFGRDRRCLRRDLATKLKEVRLQTHGSASAPHPPSHPPPSGVAFHTAGSYNSTHNNSNYSGGGGGGGGRYDGDLMSDDMRREVERQKWEESAMQDTQKKGPVEPVHFQSVVPGEIRQLGTGYYQFSTDEEQRQKQLAELNLIRDDTIVQREKRDRVKKRREAALQQRLSKVRKRQGLSTEDSKLTSSTTNTNTNAINNNNSNNDDNSNTNNKNNNNNPDDAENVDDFLAFYKHKSETHNSNT